MIRAVMKNCKNENGAVQIVEATFVFPIMFIVLFFLIYMGNAHYIKAQIEGIVETYAIKGASYCADPILETINQYGTVPGLDELSVEPYRYIFGGMNDVENQIAREVEKAILDNSLTLFNNMEPSITTNRADMVIDIFHGTRIGQSISDVFGKVNDFISSFAGK